MSILRAKTLASCDCEPKKIIFFALVSLDFNGQSIEQIWTSAGMCKTFCAKWPLRLTEWNLNNANQQVYIHTAKDVLIRINPECRIPRTFKRFSGLMGML
jgi:hypothetical protein